MTDGRKNERFIEAVFLCDHAENYGNRMSILGAFVNLITTPELPIAHRLTLVLRLTWVGEVHDETLDLSVSVRRPDGDTASSTSARLSLESSGRGEHPELASGLGFTIPLLIPLEVEGLHSVEVQLGESVQQIVPFKVVLQRKEK